MKIKNWFKSKPYWLRGGIIGLVFILIFTILFYIIESLFIVNSYAWAVISLPFTIPYIYFSLIPTFIIVFLFYFLFGALIGFIVGKIKSKKYTK